MGLSRRNFLKGAVISIAAIGVAKLPIASAVDKEARGESGGEFVDIPNGHAAKLHYVWIEADLPDPIDGVITLADNTQYVFMDTVKTRHAIRGAGSTIGYVGDMS